jgi:RNA polymerase sigma factor (sigma-70 family)
MAIHASQQVPPEHSRSVAKNESPFGPNWGPVWHGERVKRYSTRLHVNHKERQPDTDLQALMEAKPFEEPDSSVGGSIELRERLNGAVDSLPQRLKWVFEAAHYRGMSVREIGRELSISKTTAHRLYRDAVALLRERLSD